MSKKSGRSKPARSDRDVIATNRKARHNYNIKDTYEAGIALMGTEVKSLRDGHASIVDGFAMFSKNELWLENVYIPEYGFGTWTNHQARRKRKLLLHRSELNKLQREVDTAGTTIVPLSMYFRDGKAKVEIALAEGKRDYDKRHALREAQDKREAQRAMREANRRGTSVL